MVRIDNIIFFQWTSHIGERIFAIATILRKVALLSMPPQYAQRREVITLFNRLSFSMGQKWHCVIKHGMLPIFRMSASPRRNYPYESVLAFVLICPQCRHFPVVKRCLSISHRPITATHQHNSYAENRQDVLGLYAAPVGNIMLSFPTAFRSGNLCPLGTY